MPLPIDGLPLYVACAVLAPWYSGSEITLGQCTLQVKSKKKGLRTNPRDCDRSVCLECIVGSHIPMQAKLPATLGPENVVALC